jgi:hypothetical protein
MHYPSSGHDQRTKHTHTNAHPTPTYLFHFNNVDSFQGFANDIPIVLQRLACNGAYLVVRNLLQTYRTLTDILIILQDYLTASEEA